MHVYIYIFALWHHHSYIPIYIDENIPFLLGPWPNFFGVDYQFLEALLENTKQVLDPVASYTHAKESV